MKRPVLRRCRAAQIVVPAALAGLLSSCAVAPAPLAPQAPQAAPAAADRRWRVVRAPALGFSVELPGEPKEWRRIEPQKTGAPHVTQGLTVESGEGAPAYRVIRFDRPGELDRNDDATILKSQRLFFREKMTQVDVDREESWSGFHGLVVEGTLKAGGAFASRFFVVGRATYLVAFEGPSVARSRADLDRVLGSFTLLPAPRIHVIEEARCTVAVPDLALEITTRPGGAGTSLVVHAFYLGGEDELTYAVTTSPIPSEKLAQSSPDEIVQAAALGLGSVEGAQIEKLRAISVDGTPGREVTARVANAVPWVRARLFVIDGALYQVTVHAKRIEPLTGPETTRFLDSFRVRGPR